MTWVALAAVVGTALEAAVTAHIFRSMLRSHARERDLMLNQIMHLSGRTWTPPPAAREPVAPPEPKRTVGAPEQMPDHYDWSTDG